MNGSVTNFHDIYQRYAEDVYRFSFWLSGNADDAKDIMSETFIRLWTAKNDVVVETVKAYLFTIARNVFLQGKRNGKPGTDFAGDLIDPAPGPDARLEVRSELRNVLEAMQQLPEVDRAALIMKAYDNLAHQEIARVLGLSLSAVKVKIHRARLKLASIMANEEDLQDESNR